MSLRSLIAKGLVAGSVLVAPAYASSPLQVVTLGDSHSEVEGGFGAALAGMVGARVEHISRGVNGASVRALLEDLNGTRNHYQLAAMAARRPGLLILAFGTNEAKGWTQAMASRYADEWRQVLARLRGIFPAARIVVLGPPDADLPGLKSVRGIQKRVAAQFGIRWIDRVQVMGGEGTMAMWRAARGGRYASPDGIHLTVAGYSELARRVAVLIAHGA